MGKRVSLLLIMLLLVSSLALAGQREKIAVAANDKTPAALVSSQAGRGPFFLFFDGKGKLLETLDNPFKGSGGGTVVADFLAGKGVTVVVAEEFGRKIIEGLKSKGIRAIAFKGSVAEAVKKVLQSNLK